MEYGLQEIANKLGLSVSTVSRVVNNKSTVKESTRKKVLECLEEYGYSPNFLARSLKTNRTHTIGVIVPDITENLFGNIIKGINDVLVEKGYSAVLCDSDESAHNEKKYLRYLRDIRVDGLIVAMVNPDENIIREYFGDKCPVVLVDNTFDNDGKYDSVTIDNFKAGYCGTEYLIKKGHKKIGIIIGSTEQTTGRERLAGYLSAMNDYNLAVEDSFVKKGDYKENSGYSAMEEFFSEGQGISAVFATSSKMTFGAAKLLREKSLTYKDIALLGFDVADAMEIIHPKITSIIQPDRKIGEEAAKILLHRLENTAVEYQKRVIDFEIVDGETV